MRAWREEMAALVAGGQTPEARRLFLSRLGPTLLINGSFLVNFLKESIISVS